MLSRILSLLALVAIFAPSLVLGARIILVGDSTMAQSSSKTQQGWGTPFASYTTLQVLNRARGGRSARSYTREGLWASVVKEIQPLDYVIIEFGHNDGGSPTTSDRAPAPGTGSETVTVTVNGKKEIVQTFVTYLRRMANDVLAKGGVPIISSMTPNGDVWDKQKKKVGEKNRFAVMAETAAKGFNGKVAFLDHWKWVAVRYEDMGYSQVYPKLFPQDHTHTSPAGADVVAQTVVNGFKCMNHPIAQQLTAKGKAIPKICS